MAAGELFPLTLCGTAGFRVSPRAMRTAFKVGGVIAALAIASCGINEGGPVGLVGQRRDALSGDVVISQVYGGGGNANAPYNHDFVELFNRGAAPVVIGGWTVQYAAAANAFGTSNFLALPAG